MTEEERRKLPSAKLATIQKLHTAIAAVQPSSAMTLLQQRRFQYLCLRLDMEIAPSVMAWNLENPDAQITNPQLYRDVDTELDLPRSPGFPYPTVEQDAETEQDEDSPPRGGQQNLTKTEKMVATSLPSDDAETDERINQEGDVEGPEAGCSQ